MNRLRVLLVDDNEDFLEAVSAWLDDEPRLEVLATARTGREAVRQSAELDPDLVLMDVSMSELDGFGATRQIKSRQPAPRVVLLTFNDSVAARHEAVAAGADGFISKVEVTGRLLEVVRELFPELAIAKGGSARDVLKVQSNDVSETRVRSRDSIE